MALIGCGGTPPARPSGTGAGTILTWTSGNAPRLENSGVSIELNNVTFGGDVNGGGLFVAVGEAGTIVTSPDGITWAGQYSNTPLSLYGVTYGNNQFIAVGGNSLAGGGVIVQGTPDGTAWTVEDVSGSLDTNLTGVTYANGQFVAVGNNKVMTSTDGTNWSSLSSAPSGITGPTVDLYNIVYGNNLFVTVGTYNESTSTQEIAYDGLIATSPDAVNWSILPYTSNYLSGITYGGGQFVAVGREGSILTSTDGTTWTPQSVPQLNASETPYLISVALRWQSIRGHGQLRRHQSEHRLSHHLAGRQDMDRPAHRTEPLRGRLRQQSRTSGRTSPLEGNEYRDRKP